MRLLLLLVIVGICLVSAKYLPDDSSNLQRLISRQKRSNLEDSDQSSSSDTDDDSDEDIKENAKLFEKIEKMRQKLLEKQEKEKQKQEEAQKKLEEKIAKELQKEEEKRMKEEEKREKEERKKQEKLDKERRKLEEQQRKIEEKVHKNEAKRQQILEKQLKEIEEDTLKMQQIESLELETDDSVELEDFWKNYIYAKYGLSGSNTDLEKEAALKRYMQEELGLNANSTASERRRAILRLVENKLQTVSDHYALQSQLVNFINSVGVQKIRTQLEKEIEELNNKTNILNNVNLPWVPLAKENYAEQVSFLETIKGFLSSILPNWFDSNANTASGPKSSGPINTIKPLQNVNSSSVSPNSNNNNNDGSSPNSKDDRISSVDSNLGNGFDNSVPSGDVTNSAGNGQTLDGIQSSFSLTGNNTPLNQNEVSELDNALNTGLSKNNRIQSDTVDKLIVPQRETKNVLNVDTSQSSFDADKTLSDHIISNVDSTSSSATENYAINEVDNNGFANNAQNSDADLVPSSDPLSNNKNSNSVTGAVATENKITDSQDLISSSSSSNLDLASKTETVKEASISESNNLPPHTAGASVGITPSVDLNNDKGILTKTENGVTASSSILSGTYATSSGTTSSPNDNLASVVAILPPSVKKDTQVNDLLVANEVVRALGNEILANINSSPSTTISTDIAESSIRLGSSDLFTDTTGGLLDLNNVKTISSNFLPSNDPLPSGISIDYQDNVTPINSLLTNSNKNGATQLDPIGGAIENTVSILPGVDGAVERTVPILPGADGAFENTVSILPGVDGAVKNTVPILPGVDGALENTVPILPGVDGAVESTVPILPGVDGAVKNTVPISPGVDGAIENTVPILPGVDGAIENTVPILPGVDGSTGNKNAESITVISTDSSIQLTEIGTERIVSSSNKPADSLNPKNVVLDSIVASTLQSQNTITKNLINETTGAKAKEQLLTSSSNVKDGPSEGEANLNKENSIISLPNNAVIAEEVQITTAAPDSPLVTNSDVATTQDIYTNIGETVTDAGATELPVYQTVVPTEVSEVFAPDQSQLNVIVNDVLPSTEQPIITDVLPETVAPTAGANNADINLIPVKSNLVEGITTPVENGASIVDVTTQ